MSDTAKPLLIKRYASRRLYNTETSDYVTLEDIAGFVRSGRDVQIVDLKTGDDLTRQYLLQIVAEHESKGDSVLPTNVLSRPKHGFNVPIDHWLRNDWCHLIDESFADGSALRRHALVGANARSVALEMINDVTRLNGHTIFSLIMMNRWLENYER